MNTVKPKCGHSPATCNRDLCLKDGTEDPGVPREVRIEHDWERRADHARAMYHMAVAAAESELDAALAKADDIRHAELAQARNDAHGTAETASCP